MSAKEIELEQGSDEWLKWRNTGIGSSDVPAILNISKYKRPYQLFCDKTGRLMSVFKTNPGIERGKALEPVARKKFCDWYNLNFDTDETFEAACLEMSELPFMKTSLDGRSFDKKINVEIKYQGKKAHDNVKLGIVDPAYYAQIMHQMIVSGARKCFLCSIDLDEKINVLEIPFDEILCAHIVTACKGFWSLVEANRWVTEC